jgi:hypothetical protein
MPSHGRARTNGNSEKITTVRAMSLIVDDRLAA